MRHIFVLGALVLHSVAYGINVPTPVAETALTQDGVTLRYKHYPRPGAIPVLLLHGFAQNDRGWDSPIARYSFARALSRQGYDVWIGNLRGAGTEGYRSDQPSGAPSHSWTVDDHIAQDAPALVETIVERTGQRPFVIAHSMAAWIMEGYLAGAAHREQELRGLITIAGVYGLSWPKKLANFLRDPIRTERDFYDSNYELEALVQLTPLETILKRMRIVPLGWIRDVLFLTLDRIPVLGGLLNHFYGDLQRSLARLPVFSIFYYPPSEDAETVRLHARDGLEDMGAPLLLQFADVIRTGTTRVRELGSKIHLPMLFIAGDHDRLSHHTVIFRDGFSRTASVDKQYLLARGFGHLDILNGTAAPDEVFQPVIEWMRQRQ